MNLAQLLSMLTTCPACGKRYGDGPDNCHGSGGILCQWQVLKAAVEMNRQKRVERHTEASR